ncbi:MAG: hypothetical protein NXI24_00920 [bacterium]|nr:hypothetical protein [bacterium]
MTSHRILIACLSTALLLSASGALGETSAKQPFRFQSFCKFSSGDRFDIIALTGYAAGESIGTGRIQTMKAQELRLAFVVRTVATGEIRGELRLEYLGPRDRYKEKFRLRYSADTPTGRESATEIVAADAFLIQNGVLALHPSDGRRFFQLSIDSRGQSKFVTHWGASRLAAAP